MTSQSSSHQHSSHRHQPHEMTLELEQATSNYQSAKVLHEAEQYDTAVSKLQDALKIQECLLGKYHSHTIKSYWRLGRSLYMLSQSPSHTNALEKAEPALAAFKRALRMAEARYGNDHAATLTLKKDMSECLVGDPSYLTAMEAWLDHERQGDSFCKMRNHKRAFLEYTKAQELDDTVFGTRSNLDHADLLCKLAFLTRLQGDLEASRKHFSKALDLYQTCLGENHPATLGAGTMLRAVSQDCDLNRQGTGSKKQGKRSFGGSLRAFRQNMVASPRA
jgi:tetratricopeptide (TPR) repeat protein